MVAGTPYLRFVYAHLECPFTGSGGDVQLQGIGMSLLNTLCSELMVTVHKADGVMRLAFRQGREAGQEWVGEPSNVTSTTVAGRVRSELQPAPTNEQAIERWLKAAQAANPGLKVHFNGRALRA